MSWKIDPQHTHISFSARHMMVTTVRGHFEEFGGTVDFDEVNPTKTQVDIWIDAASLTTKVADRDTHLRSPDFLNVENHPYLTFKSKRVEQIDEENGRLIGDLTIRGVSREVTLAVNFAGMASSPWGTSVAGFTASTTINRKDFDLTWNVALESGGFLVSDKVKIDIELELIKEDSIAVASELAEATA
jgi:polyisoprenoid-binding protein YceI